MMPARAMMCLSQKSRTENERFRVFGSDISGMPQAARPRHPRHSSGNSMPWMPTTRRMADYTACSKQGACVRSFTAQLSSAAKRTPGIVSLVCIAWYAKCPYYVLLCMQSVLIFSAFYANWPYYLVLYMKIGLILLACRQTIAALGPTPKRTKTA